MGYLEPQPGCPPEPPFRGLKSLEGVAVMGCIWAPPMPPSTPFLRCYVHLDPIKEIWILLEGRCSTKIGRGWEVTETFDPPPFSNCKVSAWIRNPIPLDIKTSKWQSHGTTRKSHNARQLVSGAEGGILHSTFSP